MAVSEELSASIAQARDAAKLAGFDTSARSDGGGSSANVSYAYHLDGVEDGPQLADIEQALEEIPGVSARLVYPTQMAWVTAPDDLDPAAIENVIGAFGVGTVMTDSTLRRRATLHEGLERSPRQSTRGMSVRIRRRRKDAQATLSAAREAGFVRRTSRQAPDSDVLFTARDLVTPARLITAIVLSIPVIAISYAPALQFPGWQWVCLALATPVALWCALPFHRAMAGGVRRGMSALDGASSVAVIAAYMWSVAALTFTGAGEIGWTSSSGWLATRRGDDVDIFLDVACGVTMLLLVGRYYTKRAGVSLVEQMHRLTPAADTLYTVTRRGGRAGEEPLAVSEINRGDDVFVRAGEIIPVDGEVVGGSARLSHVLSDVHLNPNVKVGDAVAAGSVVERGKVKIRAQRTGHATRWALASRWVEDASKRENAATMVSTRSAGMLIPAAYALAVLDFGMWWLLTGDVNAAFSTALAVLAVVAPVALAISPALATRHGIEAAARHSILVRDGSVLRRLDEVDTVVFNRVGTLVEPVMTVETVTAARGEDPEVVLLVAAALLVESNHPASKAVVAAAREAKSHGAPWRADHVDAQLRADGSTVGRVTLRPVVDGRPADEDQAVHLDAMLWRPTNLSRLTGRLALAATSGGAPVVVRWKGKDRGVITLYDPEKADASDAVDRLEAMGATTVMLTRDAYAVGRRFADMLGITSVLAGITAQNKPGAVRQLASRGATVAMVGSTSVLDVIEVGDVGILYAEDEFFDGGFKRAEMDVDAVVLRDDVMAVPQLIEHGRRVSRIIDTNMAFALVYNGAAVALAMFGVLPPMGATVFMLGASLIIEQRSVRAGRFPV